MSSLHTRANNNNTESSCGGWVGGGGGGKPNLVISDELINLLHRYLDMNEHCSLVKGENVTEGDVLKRCCYCYSRVEKGELTEVGAD